jgi:hypothetical protein
MATWQLKADNFAIAQNRHLGQEQKFRTRLDQLIVFSGLKINFINKAIVVGSTPPHLGSWNVRGERPH